MVPSSQAASSVVRGGESERERTSVHLDSISLHFYYTVSTSHASTVSKSIHSLVAYNVHSLSITPPSTVPAPQSSYGTKLIKYIRQQVHAFDTGLLQPGSMVHEIRPHHQIRRGPGDMEDIAEDSRYSDNVALSPMLVRSPIYQQPHMSASMMAPEPESSASSTAPTPSPAVADNANENTQLPAGSTSPGVEPRKSKFCRSRCCAFECAR